MATLYPMQEEKWEERNEVPDKRKHLGTTDQSKKMQTVGSMFKDFASETSMHGLKNVSHRSRPTFVRIVWGMLVAFMAASLIYTVTELCLRFKSYPYTTFTTTQRRSKLPFPAVTFCLDMPLDKQIILNMTNGDILLDYFLSKSPSSYVFEHQLTEENITKALGNMSYNEMIENISFRASEFIIFAAFGQQMLNKTEDFRVTKNTNIMCLTFNSASQESTQKVKQWTARPNDYFVITMYVNKTRLIPSITTGIKVYIHPPAEMFGSGPPTFVPLDSLSSIFLSPIKHRFLPKPYNSFGGEDCVDTEDPEFQSTLFMNASYTHLNCIIDRSVKLAVEKCNCTAKEYREWYGRDLPLCNVTMHISCLEQSMYHFIVEEQSRDHNASGPGEFCFSPCSFTKYSLKMSLMSVPSPSFQERFPEISFDGMVQVQIALEDSLEMMIEHQPELSLSDIYSLLGGQMGFFLGASLLTLAELLEAAVILLWNYINNHCNRHGSQSVNAGIPCSGRIKTSENQQDDN